MIHKLAVSTVYWKEKHNLVSCGGLNQQKIYEVGLVTKISICRSGALISGLVVKLPFAS